MIERWEYMSLSWSQQAGESPSGDPQWRSEFGIYRGDRDDEMRLDYDFGTEDERKTTLLELLNEFGAEGWELVSETPLTTAAGTGVRGFTEVGCVVEVRFLLKRRISG